MYLITVFFFVLIIRILLQFGVFGSTLNLKNSVKTKVADIQNDIQGKKERDMAERKKLDELGRPKVPKSVGNTIKDIFND